MSQEAILALGYTGFLLLVAEGVRRFVRRKASRDRERLYSLTYDPDLPWPHWEAVQLRRAVVAVMPAVAAGILVVALIRNHEVLEATTLGTLLALSVGLTVRALRSVRGGYAGHRPPS